MLLVIDMQDYFKNSIKILDNVLEQVRRSRRNREFIILLEYKECGLTNKRIRSALKGYKNKTVVRKSFDDGAYEIVTKLDKLNRQLFRHVKVCGVNFNGCVKRTIFGLSSRTILEVTVFRSCCAGDTEENDDNAVYYLKRLRNVKIVK